MSNTSRWFPADCLRVSIIVTSSCLRKSPYGGWSSIPFGDEQWLMRE